MNAYAEGIVHLRERMKEKGFSKKDQQAIRQMTKRYRQSKSTQHKRLKLNWHTPEQESEPWEWKLLSQMRRNTEKKSMAAIKQNPHRMTRPVGVFSSLRSISRRAKSSNRKSVEAKQ